MSLQPPAAASSVMGRCFRAVARLGDTDATDGRPASSFPPLVEALLRRAHVLDGERRAFCSTVASEFHSGATMWADASPARIVVRGDESEGAELFDDAECVEPFRLSAKQHFDLRRIGSRCHAAHLVVRRFRITIHQRECAVDIVRGALDLATASSKPWLRARS